MIRDALVGLWLVSSLAAPIAAEKVEDAGSLAPYIVKDVSAPQVTAENLIRNERLWPYQVALTKRDLSAQVPTGVDGVLIRVEENHRVRIDFGRDGVHTVPVAITDVVQRANALRLGEATKIAPNLVLAIGPRLQGSPMGMLRVPLDFVTKERRGFLLVFADPKSEQFESIARALTPFSEHPGVMTALLPQTLVDEGTFGERMRSLGWKVPYVYDFLVPGYTDSLLADSVKLPAVGLFTAEGRTLLLSEWNAGLAAALEAEFARSFPVPAGQPAKASQ